MVPFERVPISIVTFPIHLRVSEAELQYVLHHATFPHPTSSLPQIPHVPLGVGGWSLDNKERSKMLC